MIHARAQHLGDLVVRQAVRGLDQHAGLDARGHLARRHRQQAVGIDLEGHADARRARHHGGNAAQLEARERAAVGDELALALHDMEGHRGLAVLEGGEFLRARDRQRGVARHDLLDQAAHGLEAERERDDVEQQPVVLVGAVACEHVCLHRRAQCDDLVGVEVGQGLLAEVVRDRALDVGHAGRAPHHHHTLDLVGREAGVAQGLAHRGQGLLDQMRGHLGKLLAGHHEVDLFARGQAHMHRGLVTARQQLLGLARLHLQAARVFQRGRRDLGAVEDPAEQAMIEVVAAERGVAVGRQHLEHAARELEDGEVEGAPAQVVHRVDALGRVVEAVGHRGGGRFVEQAQHVEPGQARRVLGGLALGVVEVGRHGDHRADQRAAEAGLGAFAQAAQDLGGDLHRALDALHRAQPHHPGAVLEVVGHRLDVGDVLEAAAHEALDRDDGVARIDRLRLERTQTDLDAAIGVIAHGRGQHGAAGLVGQADRDAVAHGGDERIGGPEVDADGEPVLVRLGGHAGFGDLQQSHRCCSVPFRVLVFEREQRFVDFLLELLDEHQPTHGVGRGLVVLVLVELRGEMPAHLARMPEQAPVQIFELGDLGRLARLLHRLAPLHLLHQELGGHRGVGLERGVDAGELEQVLGARERLAQHAKAFIDPRRPLHRAPLLEVGQVRVAVGMHAPLQLVPGGFERAFVEGIAAREAEEGEVVLRQVDAHRVRLRR
ncbi:NAD-specific glutamate dehydrogenase [Thauera aminoaromatica S2]|uniref:NAD-specific glutamate dehydrogenase n=1 Tax=Thauera aminoaromatica S2 TaxID=1234381 RepID=N6YW23_THASP|nr:NAD-specific glutamate dehydrogenase [Thauera aminoaromatica S2]